MSKDKIPSCRKCFSLVVENDDVEPLLCNVSGVLVAILR